jgi:hypothetical protein
VPAIALLKLARQSLKLWRALPPAEQEEHRNDAERVRRLALELGGPRATRLFGPGEARADEPATISRERAEVARDLKDALASLSRPVGQGAWQTAQESSRALRFGSRVTTFGHRQVRARKN